MVSNVVQTRIIAKDETGGVFNNLDRRLRNSALSANLMASAMTGAFGAALNGATSLVRGFTSAMSTAAQIQSSTLSTTGDLMNLTGLTFEQTSELVQDFRNEMAKTAADLPGQTQDYADLGASIMDNLVPAFQELGGGFDTTGFRESLDEITKFATLRAAANDIEASLAGLGVSKFLGGASVSELSQLKFFEANPAVLATIEKEAAALGQDLADLTTKQRADILQKALTVPDEVIDGMRNSTEGLIAGFRSALFDSESGFFGMLRDLDLETEGVQSIESAFNLFLRQVKSIADTFGNLIQTSGIELPNIMRGLFNGINWLTNRLAGLQNLMERLQGLGLGDFNLIQSISDFYNSLVGRLRESFNNINFTQVGENLANAFNLAVGKVNEMFANIDYGQVGKIFGDIIVGAFSLVKGVLLNLDYIGLGELFLRGVKSTIELLLSALRRAITGVVGEIGNMVSSLIPDFPTPPSVRARPTANIPGRRVQNSFLGNIPTGFLDAVRRETLGKPSGSDLTVANTSELILNAAQQDNLISAIGSLVTGGTGGGIQIGSINVTSTASNPKQVAKEVANVLWAEVQQTRQNMARA